jgi:lipopolysaccharide biosynthesis glycosyltransferase
MNTAVITLTVGRDYERIAALTHPTLKAYAEKIGAKFICINQRSFPNTVPVGYEKLRIPELFEIHNLDRAIFLDSDLIVREDCPSLFQFVPEGWFGAFNEGEWMDDRKKSLVEASKLFKVSLVESEKWGTRYYNTGVMVFDKSHLKVFERPDEYHNQFYEQSWLNIQLNRKLKLEYIKNVGVQFNRMSHVDVTSTVLNTRWENYIIHYAGVAKELGNDSLLSGIREDLARWEEMKKENRGYEIPRKFKISIGGGLGDQIDSEPVVREIRRLYPHDHLIVASHWPEIYQDLPYHLDEVVDIRTHYNTNDIVHVFHTYAGPDTEAGNYLTHVLMNSTDFSSQLTIRRQLPPEKKLIKIRYTEEQCQSMLSKLKLAKSDLKDAVLIHPGRSWYTKTLDSQVWNDAILKMKADGVKLILVGKNDNYLGPRRGPDNIGLTNVDVSECIFADARDKLSVKETLALIDHSFALVSNDSAPIHLAGATDCWILGFFTAKHPEFVLPHRLDPKTGEISQRHKVIELNSRPKCWPCNVDAVTTKPSEVRADHCLNFEKQHECHPTAEKIASEVKYLVRGHMVVEYAT